uniref:Rho_N domain-containing protein n=1 Tax=Strongyloides venezuelensis TaxID=75913 RepID=A0A0K0FHF6_STRVS
MSASPPSPQTPQDSDHKADPGNDQLKQQLQQLTMVQLKPLAKALEIHVPAVIKKSDLIDLIAEEEPNVKLEDFSTILTINQSSGSKTSNRISTRQSYKIRPTDDSDDENEPPEDNHLKSDNYGHSHPTQLGFNTHRAYSGQPHHPPTPSVFIPPNIIVL